MGDYRLNLTQHAQAEMALATLNGSYIPSLDPPWVLKLSHTPSLASPLPEEPLCAQAVVQRKKESVLQTASAQELFEWFRVAGPLVSVQTNVKLRFQKPCCVVQYWNEKDALFALRHARYMHPVLKSAPWFMLCTVVPSAITAKVCRPPSC